MSLLGTIASFLIQIISNAKLLIAVIVAVGLLVQKKSFSSVLAGAMHATMGMLMLSAGSSIFSVILSKFTPLIQLAFGTEGLMPSNETFLIIATDLFGSEISLVLVVAFLTNLAIARFTKWKYINLVTHHWLFAGAMLTVIFHNFGVENSLLIVVLSGLFAGAWATFIPHYLDRYAQKAANGDAIAIGHFGGLFYYIGGFLGEHFGDASDSMEELSIPEKFKFLKDDKIVTFLITGLFFFVITLFVPYDVMVSEGIMEAGSFKALFALGNTIEFCAAIVILRHGVKMLLGEVLPAFKGIATVIVPNAKPALDCSVMMAYGPTTVTVGFIISMAFSVLASFVMQFMGGVLVVPPVLSCFYMGGVSAVFANATGGKRGVVLSSVVNGILFSALPLLLYSFTGSMPGLEGFAISDSDFIVLGSLVGTVLKGLGSLGLL